MPLREVRHGVLGGLAGGSLLTGVPWTRIFRAVRKSVESDSVNLAITVVANFLIESPTISRALSWLLILAILYAYTDLVYLRRVEPLTDRRDFRLLTAVIAGSATFLIPQSHQLLWAVYSVTLIFVGIAVFSVYLWYTPFDPFDPDGVILPFWTRMAGADPEEVLNDLAEASGWYYSVVVFGIYGVPAAVFTATCFVLGLVMVTLIEMYPLPEVAVLVVLGATLIDQATPDRIADRVRHRLHIEDRIFDPLAAATATIEGLLLTCVCLLGLFWGAIWIAISISIAWDLLIGDFLARVSWILAAPLPFEEALGLGLFMSYLLVLVLSMSIYGLYGILFWLRELQRVPAVIHDDSTGVDGRSDADVPEFSTTIPRIPGAMIPANLLFTVSIGSAAISVRHLQVAYPETPDELAAVSLSLADIWGMTILLAVVLLWVCWRTVRSTWSQSTSQPTHRERLVIGVAAIGMMWAFALPLGLGPTVSEGRAIAVAIVGAVAILGLIFLPRFVTGSQTLPQIGSVSEDTVRDGVVVIGLIAAAGVLHWLLPGMFQWVVPAVLLGLAILLVGVKVIKWRQ